MPYIYGGEGCLSIIMFHINHILNNKRYWCCLANATASSPWVGTTRKGLEIFHWALLSIYQSPVTHVAKSSRHYPSIFVDCMQSNTGGGNGLGTRLTHRHMVSPLTLSRWESDTNICWWAIPHPICGGWNLNMQDSVRKYTEVYWSVLNHALG